MEKKYIIMREFNSMNTKEIIDFIKHSDIIVVHNESSLTEYNVIQNNTELENYLLNIDSDSNNGYIFNIKLDHKELKSIINKLEKFENLIFLHPINLLVNAKDLESEMFQVINCNFRDICLISYYNDFEIEVDNSVFFNKFTLDKISEEKGSLSFCLKDSNVNALEIDGIDNLLIHNSVVDSFIYSFTSASKAFYAPKDGHTSKNIIINQSTIDRLIFSNFLSNKLSINQSKIMSLDFNGLIINYEFSINQISLQNHSFFKVQNTTCYGKSQINFAEAKGEIRLYKVFFQQCFLDYDQLESNNYNQLISSESTKYTKWSFHNCSTLFKQNGKYDQYLTTFRKHKIWENKEKIENMRKGSNSQKIISYFYSPYSMLINITSGYFTKPFNTICSIIFLLFFFSIIYLIPNFKCGDKEITLNYFESLYFSIISFTIIGYGDISPLGFTRFIAGVEGLFGVILISVLTITFTRKYIL